jgi:hypothetical protein
MQSISTQEPVTNAAFDKTAGIFYECSGPVFDYRRAFILWHPYSISKILIVKLAFLPPWRDGTNYRARLRGVWDAAANTLSNESVSVHRSTRGIQRQGFRV